MKLQFVFILGFMLQSLAAESQCHSSLLNLQFQHNSLKEVLQQLEEQTDYSFIYQEELISSGAEISGSFRNKEITEILEQVLADRDLTYTIKGKAIVILSTDRDYRTFQPQQLTVRGTVTDASGVSLPGVTVVLKETTQGTITGADGNYVLTDVPADGILVFSFVGMQTQEIPVQSRLLVNVSLAEETIGIEEVVAIGYGTMRRSDLTGAVASVKTQDLTAIASTNALKTLQGKVSGLDITQSSGQPGSDVSILMRGNRSLAADNKPLILVDGIAYGSTLDINPSDIASVEVLKDVSSTAIYGTRGANGVILISTLKGKKMSKTNISVNAYVSTNDKSQYPNVMNGEQYYQVKREAYRTTNNDEYRNDEDIFQVDEYQYIQNKQFENWQDYIFHKGLTQNYEISMTGGAEKTSYSVSVGYQNDKGLLKNDRYSRVNVRTSFDHQISDMFSFGLNAIFTNKNQDKRDNPLNMAQKILPIAKAFNDDGTLNLYPAPGYSAQFNPLADEVPGVFRNNLLDKRLFASAYLQANILNNLVFKSTIGLDNQNYRRGYFKDYNTIANVGRESTSGVENNVHFSYTWENTLSYMETFGRHDFNFLIGTSTIQDRLEEYTSSGKNQASGTTSYHDIGSNTLAKEITSSLEEYQLASFFGRVNYKFDNRYLFQASLRADGSSVLAKGNKWGYFPSVSGAWRLSEESFFNAGNVDNLKLRLSWGEAGNSAIDPYSTLGGLTKSVYAFGSSGAYGYWPSDISNPDLTWETTATWNIGLDFGLFNHRISGNIDVYKSNTTDLLLPTVLPTSTGYSSIMQNVGEVENKGVELLISTVNVDRPDFRWTTDWTWFKNKEEIVALSSGVTSDEANSWFVGKPTQVVYDYKKIGIWQLGEEAEATAFGGFKPGEIRVADISGNEKFGADDRTTFSQVPKFSFGINNYLEYKNFDLTVFVFGRIGQYIDYEYYGFYRPSALVNGANVDYWTPENPTNAFPRPNSAYSENNYLFQSTLEHVKGSFVKIRDITLGYSLPKSLASRLALNNARIYCTLQNYFTFSSIDDYDPERGGDLSFPLTKQLIFGINVDL
ncbi:MAG: SusC/RagA family TonB-linked outer membrane protein [Mangrovibacterium sp.]